MIFPDTLHKSNNVEEQPLPDNKKNKKKRDRIPLQTIQFTQLHQIHKHLKKINFAIKYLTQRLSFNYSQDKTAPKLTLPLLTRRMTPKCVFIIFTNNEAAN